MKMLRILSVLVASALMSLSVVSAQADLLPGDWESSEEYHYGDAAWATHRKLPQLPGNWHTGWISLEDNDDMVVGAEYHWSCPAGVTPPQPRPFAVPAATTCTLRAMFDLQGDRWGDPRRDLVITYDHAGDTLSFRGIAIVLNGGAQVGERPYNVTVHGVGESTVTESESDVNGYLWAERDERWDTTEVSGRIGKISLSSPRVTVYPGVLVLMESACCLPSSGS